MKVIICGQKQFAKEVLMRCEKLGLGIVAVVTPDDDHCVKPYAIDKGYQIISASKLTVDTIPDDCDLGICAHFFDWIHPAVIASTKHGFIGYHPSLLPRHRGRSSIEWALQMKDVITGGTIYWLNERMDHGEIAYQDWIWLDHDKSAKEVWKEELMPMGLNLFETALRDIRQGLRIKVNQKQWQKFATVEPGL